MKIEKQIEVFSIFRSIQGESVYMGLPCVFLRLAGCDIECAYCDTKEAWIKKNSLKYSIYEIEEKIKLFKTGLVEVTGGEPLYQKNTKILLKRLCDIGYEVLLETSGAYPIDEVDNRVKIIMDIKTPGAKPKREFYSKNIAEIIRRQGQVKFVISNYEDFEFACKVTKKNNLSQKCDVLISPIGSKNLKNTAEWILKSNLCLRLQPQLHKIIWPDATTEV